MVINTITIDLQEQSDGTFDTWIATEGSSGAHYKGISSAEIGIHVKELIDCLAEAE